VPPSPVGKGLSPDPPELVRTANDWTVEQVYWIATHGVGDTGMPAFGVTQEEQVLWAIASFVKQLPSLTPAEYQKLVAKSSPPRQQP
jgi:mono/diheme cytochrome c family protein